MTCSQEGPQWSVDHFILGIVTSEFLILNSELFTGLTSERWNFWKNQAHSSIQTLPLTPALCLLSYLSIHCYRRLILLCLPATKQRQVLFVPVCRLCKACLPRLVGKSFHHLCKYNDQACKATTISWQWFQAFLGHQRRRLWKRRNVYFLASVSIAYKR